LTIAVDPAVGSVFDQELTFHRAYEPRATASPSLPRAAPIAEPLKGWKTCSRDWPRCRDRIDHAQIDAIVHAAGIDPAPGWSPGENRIAFSMRFATTRSSSGRRRRARIQRFGTSYTTP